MIGKFIHFRESITDSKLHDYREKQGRILDKIIVKGETKYIVPCSDIEIKIIDPTDITVVYGGADKVKS